jgi:DNA-binding PadR family transcriptional regulator
MQEIARQSEERYKLGPGTLYDNLQKLLGHGLVAEAVADGDPRRRPYRLTSLGQKVLSAEIKRLEGVVFQAKVHLQQLRRS